MTRMDPKEAFIRRKIAKQRDAARRRQIAWGLDVDVVVREVLRNPFCQKTGQPLNFEPNYIYTFSIDRIDSALGYHYSNVQYVGASINLAKSNLLDDDFVEMCCEVAQHRALSIERLNPI
jgi:hypothetical protein